MDMTNIYVKECVISSEHAHLSPVLAFIPSHVRGTLRTCSAETTEGHGLMSHWQGWPAWTRLLLSEARGQRTNHPKYCPGTFVSLRNHKLLKPWKVST